MTAPAIHRYETTRRRTVGEVAHAGITCTVGRSRVRHAALLIPDQQGRARLVPACHQPVDSWRPEGRVLPYLFSNVVTCKRGGCRSPGAPSPQLMLDLDL